MTSNMAESQMDDEKRLKALKFSRRGKKSSITKRVNELERLVTEGGSRKRIQYLVEAMLKVFQEITEVCLQISILSDELDEKNDLELVKANIDSCVALVSEYLDSRRDDPPSKSSLCSSWVAKHAVGMMENVSRDGQSTDVASSSPEEQLSTREPSITEEPLWVAEIGDQGIGGNVEDRPTNGVDKTGEIGGWA